MGWYVPQVCGLVGSTLIASTEAGRVPLKGPTYCMAGYVFLVLVLSLASVGSEDDDVDDGAGCGRRAGAVGVVVVDVDCVLELFWNHSHSRYLQVKSPSLPWEMESPQTSILTVFGSGLEAIAADGEEGLSVAGSGTASPLVRGTAIMAVMAERSAEARILPRQMSCLMSHITSTGQFSMHKSGLYLA